MIVAACLLALGSHARLAGAEPAACDNRVCRPQDQVWVVSCRGLGCPGSGQIGARAGYLELDRRGRWHSSHREEFDQTATADLPTTVFVSGNNFTNDETIEVGLANYHDLVRLAPNDSAIRFVIWSWPSDPVERAPVQDVRVKARRADIAACHLADWLGELCEDGPLTLIGASLGARVVAGALHLRGGGQLAGYSLPEPDVASRPPARLVLVSAAFDDDWLAPGRRFGLALPQVERVLIINNHTDKVLKWYRLLYGRRSKAAALGYCGLARGHCFDCAKIEQVDVSGYVGRKHGCRRYFQSPPVVAMMVPYVW